MKVISETCRVQ